MKTKRLTALLTSLVMTLTLLGGMTALADDTSAAKTIDASEKGIFLMDGSLKAYKDFNRTTVGLNDASKLENELDSFVYGMSFTLSELPDIDFVKSVKLNISNVRPMNPFITGNTYNVNTNNQSQMNYLATHAEEWQYTAGETTATYNGASYTYSTYLYPMADWDLQAPNEKFSQWADVDYSTYTGYPNTNINYIDTWSKQASKDDTSYTLSYDVTADIKAKIADNKTTAAYVMASPRNGVNFGNNTFDYNCLKIQNATAQLSAEILSNDELLQKFGTSDMTASAVGKYLDALFEDGDEVYKKYVALSEEGKAGVDSYLYLKSFSMLAELRTELNTAIENNLTEDDLEGYFKTVNAEFGAFNLSGNYGDYRFGIDNKGDGFTSTNVFGTKFDISDISTDELSDIKSVKLAVLMRAQNYINGIPCNTAVYPMTTEWPAAQSAWSKALSEYTGYPNTAGIKKVDSDIVVNDTNNGNTILEFDYDVTADLKAKVTAGNNEVAYAMAVLDADPNRMLDYNSKKARAVLKIEKYTDLKLIREIKAADNFDLKLKNVFGTDDYTVKLYNSLSAADKETVKAIVKGGEYTTLYGFKTAIDTECAKFSEKNIVVNENKSERSYITSNKTWTNGNSSQFRIGFHDQANSVNYNFENRVTAGMKFDLSDFVKAEDIKNVSLVVETAVIEPLSEKSVYKADLYPMNTGTVNTGWDVALDSELTATEGLYPCLTNLEPVDSCTNLTYMYDTDNKWYKNFSFKFDVTEDIKSKLAANGTTVAYALDNVRSVLNNSGTATDCLNGTNTTAKLVVTLNKTDADLLTAYNNASDKSEILTLIMRIEKISSDYTVDEIKANMAANYDSYEKLIAAIKAVREISISNVTGSNAVINYKLTAEIPVMIFAAAYKGKRLVDIKTDSISVLTSDGSANAKAYTFSYDFSSADYDTINVFVWDGIGSIKPYCPQGTYTK